jgi:hypothetical protein
VAIVYKFVELSIVTDQTIEEAVNEWVSQGWQFDDIRFVKTEHSRRPAMAFVSFVRDAPEDEQVAPRTPRKLDVDRAEEPETTFDLEPE